MVQIYPKWEFFRKRDLGAKNVDPAEDLFLEKLPPLGAIIRESTQNSLDASKNGHQVRMKISMKTGANSLSPTIAKKYFNGLFPHLEASGIKTPETSEPMDYVVVEDFGTKGLEGDSLYNGIGGEQPDNRFYWFHRNIGRTNEDDKKRGGSYGYGKHAFANASKIKTFFSVSRDKDGIKIFGNSVGKQHQLGDKIFLPYGDYGELKNFGERGNIVIPSDSEKLFLQMQADFGLSRKEETGLSVIIPYPKDKYREEEIIESMIRAYFLPICQSKLVVEVEGSHTISINANTIANICDNRVWSGQPAGARVTTSRKCMNGLIELANWWCSGNANEISLHAPSENNIYWNSDLIPSESYDTMRSRLDSGKPIALNIEVPIYKKLENNRTPRVPSKSRFTILIKKDEAYGRNDAIWIRRYLSVPITSYLPNKKGYIAIMISEDGELEELLRSSEEVAHTEHRVKRIESKYKHGGDILRFFRKSASILIEYLQIKKDLFEKDWIDDWFPSEEIEESSKPRKRKRKKKTQQTPEEDDDEEIIIGPPPPPEDLTDNHSWELQKIPGGYCIHGDIKLKVNYVFRVKMAYARDDGKDPMKKWKPFDFDIEKLNLESAGIEIEKIENNTIVFTAIGPTDEYSIDVTGFDIERDLSVHCKPTLIRGEDDGE
ncbi:hypothetical protein OAO46_00515 [Candidatus Poseidonia alphae]|nr:hypothetical protein [Candidatus Poseidonia alphae]